MTATSKSQRLPKKNDELPHLTQLFRIEKKKEEAGYTIKLEYSKDHKNVWNIDVRGWVETTSSLDEVGKKFGRSLWKCLKKAMPYSIADVRSRESMQTGKKSTLIVSLMFKSDSPDKELNLFSDIFKENLKKYEIFFVKK